MRGRNQQLRLNTEASLSAAQARRHLTSNYKIDFYKTKHTKGLFCTTRKNSIYSFNKNSPKTTQHKTEKHNQSLLGLVSDGTKIRDTLLFAFFFLIQITTNKKHNIVKKHLLYHQYEAHSTRTKNIIKNIFTYEGLSSFSCMNLDKSLGIK